MSLDWSKMHKDIFTIAPAYKAIFLFLIEPFNNSRFSLAHLAQLG